MSLTQLNYTFPNTVPDPKFWPNSKGVTTNVLRHVHVSADEAYKDGRPQVFVVPSTYYGLDEKDQPKLFSQEKVYETVYESFKSRIVIGPFNANTTLVIAPDDTTWRSRMSPAMLDKIDIIGWLKFSAILWGNDPSINTIEKLHKKVPTAKQITRMLNDRVLKAAEGKGLIVLDEDNHGSAHRTMPAWTTGPLDDELLTWTFDAPMRRRRRRSKKGGKKNKKSSSSKKKKGCKKNKKSSKKKKRSSNKKRSSKKKRSSSRRCSSSKKRSSSRRRSAGMSKARRARVLKTIQMLAIAQEKQKMQNPKRSRRRSSRKGGSRRRK